MTLQVKDVSKAIAGKMILEAVSFEMTVGSVIGLVGRNGAGKTTLMRLIAGEMLADNGEILLGEKGRASVFYVDTLSNWMSAYHATTVIDVLTMFYPEFDQDQFMMILSSQNLPTDKTISTFSKGQKALVYLAAGIASQATYLSTI